MLVAWNNLADAAAVTAGSQVASLPATNVQLALLSLKWGTAAGVKSSNLVFDMGTAQGCAVLAVLGTNLTPTATMRLRASNSDPTGAAGEILDTGTISANVKTGYGAIYYPFTLATARYWRLDLADASLADNMLVGRVVLAPTWKPPFGFNWGWSVTSLDPSTISKSYGGQAYADIRPQQRVLAGTIDFMAETDAYGSAFVAMRANGVVKDVLVIPFETGARISEESVWGLCQVSKPIPQRLGQIFTMDISVEERL